ncbi:MAG: cytochrome c [Chloroflexi bacterium]|nr:cytochrome c [Chloroflexota bacterium]
MKIAIKLFPVSRQAKLRLAVLLILIAALACTRPDGTDIPQVLSPFLLATSTPAPTPTPLPTATATPLSATPPSATVIPTTAFGPEPAPTSTSLQAPSTPPQPIATQTSSPTPEPAPEPSPAPPEDLSGLSDEESGLQTFDSLGCSACHTVGGIQSTSLGSGDSGPALDGFSERAGERVPGLTAVEYAEKSILTPDGYIVPGYRALPHLPQLENPLSEDELSQLIAYLLSIPAVEEVQTATPTPIASETAAAFDPLSGSGSLDRRQPPVGPQGAPWEVEGGDWFLTIDGAGEESGINADLRTVLKLPERPGVVSVDLQLNSGLAGLVLRYVDFAEWAMVWFNDETNTLDVGTLSSGTFTQILSVPYQWDKEAGFRQVSVVDSGDSLRVLIDGEEAATVEMPAGFDGTGVGMFNRASTNNLFRNFTAETIERPQVES